MDGHSCSGRRAIILRWPTSLFSEAHSLWTVHSWLSHIVAEVRSSRSFVTWASKQTCCAHPQPRAHTHTCADLIKTSSPQRPTLFRPGFLAYNPHNCTGSLFRRMWCLVSGILKFLIIFKWGALHFHFALHPAIFVASPDCPFLSLQHYILDICGYFCLRFNSLNSWSIFLRS